MNDKCLIWGTSCKEMNLMIHLPRDRYDWEVNSPRAGGKYRIADTASGGMALALEELSKVKLSRWIYQQNQLGEPLKINTNTLEKAKIWPMPSVSERMDYCLQFLESKTKALGRAVKIAPYLDEIKAASLLKDNEETRFLIEQIEGKGWIEIKPGAVVIRSAVVIISKGYQRLEELKKANVESDQAFVALWLHSSMDKAWEEGFEPGIRNAGYKALRIDRNESNDKIDDEIIAEIRRSRFLVADFTSPLKNARGSVYYEAGFAHGLNIPVIFTCRKDLIDKNHIHFDTRQYPHIRWEKKNLEDLHNQLKKRILATIGDGPHQDENSQH